MGAYAEKSIRCLTVRPTVHFDHIKRHYYMSHRSVNPTGIVPVGPEHGF
jgi:glutathionyl-hydroquinone reductase